MTILQLLQVVFPFQFQVCVISFLFSWLTLSRALCLLLWGTFCFFKLTIGTPAESILQDYITPLLFLFFCNIFNKLLLDFSFVLSSGVGLKINPLGPRTTKVINASRVLRDLAPLLTLLSPPRTSPKLPFSISFFRIAS